MKTLILSTLLGFGFIAHAESKKSPAPATATAPCAGEKKASADEKPLASSGLLKRGAPLSAQKPVSLDDVLAAPAKYADKKVVVEGKVRANCTKQGCWMELAPSLTEEAQGCRVTFKDHGFFVPLDSRGSTAKVEGTIAVRTIDKEEVAHLEGEGGHFVKDKDGTAREIRIVATGVELHR